MNIVNASSMEDHVLKALGQEFYLSKEIPLPEETTDSLRVVTALPTTVLKSFWTEQLDRVRTIVADSAITQQKWWNATPDKIKSATGKFRYIPMMTLMDQLNLGGSRWLQQFAWGFPLIGDLSQNAIYPIDPKVVKPPDPTSIGFQSAERFRLRAAASGFLNSDALWTEALEQVNRGWLSEPVPIDMTTGTADLPYKSQNFAFRFGVRQMDKLRACDDLRYSTTNAYCSVRTPIKLPTWDHLAQMAANVTKTDRKWGFFKADHESAYKMLPIKPAHIKMALVTLRDPSTDRWHAFAPRATLFGAVSAVLHYNAFSRALAVTFTKLTGIPILSYFDDFGALVPYEVLKDALDTFLTFCDLLGVTLKTTKTEWGESLTLLGLRGDFPKPENLMTLAISLPEDKKSKWTERILDILREDHVTHPELESVIGRLSFSQTSIFGRVGRVMLSPLYTKLHSPFYTGALTECERNSLLWWSVALPTFEPRRCHKKGSVADSIVYTDAATKTSIIAFVELDPVDFRTSRTLKRVAATRVPPKWISLFDSTSLIYGLETAAVLAFFMDPDVASSGPNITIYIDNNNTLEALIQNVAKPPVITAMVQLIWHRIRTNGLNVWFERVPSKRNIADIPTKLGKMIFETRAEQKIDHLNEVYRLVIQATDCVKKGLAVPSLFLSKSENKQIKPPIWTRRH